MNQSEMMRMIKSVVRNELALASMALQTDTADQKRATTRRFATDSPIDGLRSIQPFGVSSRAPDGTDCMQVPVGGDPSHMNVIGHFDPARPAVEKGETMLYNEFGDRIYVSDGVIIATTPQWVLESDAIFLGSDSADEPFVLGKVFKQFAEDVLQAIAIHTHISALPGYPTPPPQNAVTFQTLKASPIQDEAILSDKIFGEKG